MRILGIDPGLVKSGWALLEAYDNKVVYLDSGLCKTSIKLSIYERFFDIFNFFEKLIIEIKPDCAALEETFVNMNKFTSLKLYGARTAISLALQRQKITFKTFQATTVKKTLTGHGRAEKVQLQEVLQKIVLNMPNNLSLDCSDAVALAYCYFINNKELIEIN